MAESLLSGTGSALVAASPAVAFAFLADPRNAGAWFAGSGFAEAPSGSPRAGMTWRFERMRGTRRPVPVRMSVYEPPARFVWETRLGLFGANNAWELRIEPASVASAEPDEPSVSGARVTLTIRLRPRLLGWLAVLPALPLLRGQLPARA
ncbi:MAG TPA: SRPBCC family protein, partial [Ktedonobacterales bacterium]|nr:SRPBCC family protein [Ktedonobacterales bacterium]